LSDITIGRFQWGGHEFTERARNITFNPEEGGSRVPVLRAELQDDAFRYLQGDVNLAERINNREGQLQFSW
jgi:CVNH domain.